MELIKALAALAASNGVSGNEAAGACGIAQSLFQPLAEEVWQDINGNVFARVGNGAPVVLVMAHNDEVGLMVTDIEKNGMLRLRSVAGVDPRILPGSEVVVHGTRDVCAVIGATPPHLTAASEKDKAYRIEELICDTGLSPAHVLELISVGDFVTFAPLPPLELKNGRLSSKTMDDRALVATLARLLELMSSRKPHGTLIVCASVQEEKTGLGAITASRRIQPDIGVAVDVTHPYEKNDIDKLSISCGSNIHPGIYSGLCKAAGELRIPFETEAEIGPTGTDAWEMQIQCRGIPTGLLNIPLMYMHTSVEIVDLQTLEQCAQLLCQYIISLNGHWEEQLCLDD